MDYESLRDQFGFDLSKYSYTGFTLSDWADELDARSLFFDEIMKERLTPCEWSELAQNHIRTPINQSRQYLSFLQPVTKIPHNELYTKDMTGNSYDLQTIEDNTSGGRVLLSINPRAPIEDITKAIEEIIAPFQKLHSVKFKGKTAKQWEQQAIKDRLLPYLDLWIIRKCLLTNLGEERSLSEAKMNEFLGLDRFESMQRSRLKEFAFSSLEYDFITWLKSHKSVA